MKNIGLFGGSFNPPHFGHIQAVNSFVHAACLDFVYIMPAGQPPHKEIVGATPIQRLEMAKIAFFDMPFPCVVSEMEIKRGGNSYTADTLEELHIRHPHDRLFLYVGTDMFRALDTWHLPQKVFSLAIVCCMSRDRDEAMENQRMANEYKKRYHANILMIPDAPVIVSSTLLRRGEKPECMPEKVRMYAQEAGLYKRKIPERIQAVLDGMSEERRNHSMAVAEETITLCILYGLNPDTLFEAALLHDMTRGKTPREQRELADIYGGCVEEDFLSFSVTHGKTAAAMAKAMFDLEEEACLAIAYHTTGRAHMTLSEKILYVADYIEPTRRHIVCQEARRNFYAGLPPKREKREEWLDQCILSGINDTITHLHMQNRHVHVDTIQAKKAFETPKR